MDHLDPRRVDEACGIARDQRDVGAALGHHPSHRIALLARTAVADEAHRVDRLAGAAGADEDLHAGQVVRQRVAAVQQQLGQRGDLLGLGQPARAAVGAGEPARRRLQNDRARDGATWRRCRRWPGETTSRCASRARTAQDIARSAASRSAGRRRGPRRPAPADRRSPGRPRRGRPPGRSGHAAPRERHPRRQCELGCPTALRRSPRR